MNALYVVALMVARSTGSVETIESSGPFPTEGCQEMAKLARLMASDEAPGYELSISCVARDALESSISQNNCRLIETDDTKGLSTHTYACEASWMTRFLNWGKSLWH